MASEYYGAGAAAPLDLFTKAPAVTAGEAAAASYPRCQPTLAHARCFALTRRKIKEGREKIGKRRKRGKEARPTRDAAAVC